MPESSSYPIDNTRQISFKMHAKGKEIRNHQDVVNTARHECFDGAFEVGLAQLQKRSFHGFEPAGGGQLAGGGTHRLISRFQARAVSENDDSGGQVP